MKDGSRRLILSLYSLDVGLVGLGALVVLSRGPDLRARLPFLLLFVALSFLVKRSGFHVAPGDRRAHPSEVNHSLAGIVDIAALLVYGPLFGGWVAAISDFLCLEFNALRHRPRSFQANLEAPLFHSGFKALVALASGAIYQELGGYYALTTVPLSLVLPLLILFVTWFVLDHLGWGTWIFLWAGWEELKELLRTILVPSFLVEFLPLPLSVIIAVGHTTLDWPVFLLLALALVLASLVVQRLADVLRQLQARVVELSTLNELGQAIVRAQLDVGQLCQLAYEYTGKVVDTSTFLLELIDEEKGQIHLPIWTEDGVRQESLTWPMSGTTAWMRQTKSPLLIRDYLRETLPFQGKLIGTRPSRSAVFVPMLAGQKLIGVLSIQSGQPDAFNDDHLRILSAIGNQLAIAIEDARLYERERRRAEQLKLINEVGRSVTSILDVDRLLEEVVRLVRETFNYYHVGIALIEGQEGVFRAGSSAHGVSPLVGDRFRVGQEGICGWVAGSGETLCVPDVSQEPRYAFVEGLAETRSELALPLQVKEQVIGVIDIQSDRLDAFDESDLTTLQSLAAGIAVAIENARLYQVAVDKGRMEQELRVAQEIQASFLPESCPSLAGWQIAASWQPAREVAGDFYDFVPLEENRLGIVIADVSDKGVPAALFMALARTLVRTMAFGKRKGKEAIELANDLIIADARSDMFVTLFYALLDPATGTLTYVNAGHNPPLLFRPRTGEFATLRARGIALGVLEKIELEEKLVTLEPGDLVILYTDGVIETLNEQGEEFGEERLTRLIAENPSQSALELVDRIKEALAAFMGGQLQFDDYALLVVKRTT